MQANLKADASLKGRTVLLPAISAGNVGQLAVDLLIASSGMSTVGYLRDPANILPCVGSNPYAESSHECSAEMQLYTTPGAETVVLQQRAPPMLGRQEKAAQALAAFLQQQAVEKVVVLGSYSRAVPGQEPTSGAALRFKISDEAAFGSVLNVDWQELEGRNDKAKGQVVFTILQEVDPLTDKAYTDLLLPPWPFWRACEAAGLPVMLLMLAVNEGDNRGDAMRLAAHALQALQDQSHVGAIKLEAPMHWVVPPSWIVYGQQRAIY